MDVLLTTINTGLAEFIGSYGFPIFACCCMGWHIKHITDSNNAEVKKLNEEHKEELKVLAEAINNNTSIMEKLLTKMGEKKGE